MSKSLLGMMRNLDSDEVLTFINASDAGYAGLYRIRSTSEPSFTSDYGLAHSQHDLLPLSEEEACRLWEEYHKQSQCGSHETKVFSKLLTKNLEGIHLLLKNHTIYTLDVKVLLQIDMQEFLDLS